MLLKLFIFATIAILSINALSIESSPYIARHNLIAKNARRELNKRAGRCIPRSTSSSSSPPPASTQAPAPTSTAAPAPSPSPSSTPAPSPATTGKRGLAWSMGDDPSPQGFLSPKVSFLYNWGAQKPDNLYGLEFITMLWGVNQVQEFQSLAVAGYAKYAAGFNEPDLGTQSAIDPTYAATLWQQYMEPLKNDGYTLISPAVTSGSSGKTWLQTFINACTGCHIDIIAVHWYGLESSDFITYVNDFHTTFGRNIMVTEYGCENFAGGEQANADQISAFMGAVSSWMDNTDYVEAYFAFGAMKTAGNVSPLLLLMNPDGSPTSLGSQYIWD